MSRVRSMTPMQLAAAVAREREGRPDLARMTAEERRTAGEMTLQEAVDWLRLPIVPIARLGELSRGPMADDIWAGVPLPQYTLDRCWGPRPLCIDGREYRRRQQARRRQR